MTKKQLKKFAKDLADLEFVIQTSNDNNEVDLAKEKMIKLTNSANLEFNEILELDEIVGDLVRKKLAT